MPNTNTTYRTNATYRNRALWVIFSLLLIRLIALKLSPYGLHGDEAQYWSWAQDLDWGYFSKPPMIAWLIAATTGIFGDAEWAARLASPILHSATAFLIFLTGRKAYSARAGFWACSVYMLMPAVWVSSMIISTDVALLFFWAAALYAWISLRQSPSWRFAILLGGALGLGLMSKYAMMFFIPPLIIAAIFDMPTRKALYNLKGAAAALIAVVIFAPNIWWNVNHDFATITHTAANTNLEGKTRFFHPLEFLRFFGDQLGMFGPLPFLLLLLTLATIKTLMPNTANQSKITADTISSNNHKHAGSVFIYLSLFTLTPLIAISIQAFLSRANANWAASAYVSASLLLGIAAMQFLNRKAWLSRGLLAQSLFCSALLCISLFPAFVDRLGAANAVKRLRAWPDTIEAIEIRFAAGHEGQRFESIVLDHRLMFYDAQYYGLPNTAPTYIWHQNAAPKHHAELTHPFTKQGGGPVLFVNYSGNIIPKLRDDFTRLEALEPIDINLGGGKTRNVKIWAAYGYKARHKR